MGDANYSGSGPLRRIVLFFSLDVLIPGAAGKEVVGMFPVYVGNGA